MDEISQSPSKNELGNIDKTKSNYTSTKNLTKSLIETSVPQRRDQGLMHST